MSKYTNDHLGTDNISHSPTPDYKVDQKSTMQKPVKVEKGKYFYNVQSAFYGSSDYVL